MTGYPEPLRRLMAEFGRLPGIGTKTAERLAFYIVKCEPEDAARLAGAITDAKAAVRPCRVCFNVATSEECGVCADGRRDRGLVMVVEHPRDLAAFERVGRWRGVYHVLLGRIAPHEGEGPEHLSAKALEARVKSGEVREVVIATNPDAEGDAAALLIERLLAPYHVLMTRPSRGMPFGGSIEFAGAEVLAEAIERRARVGAAPSKGGGA